MIELNKLILRNNLKRSMILISQLLAIVFMILLARRIGRYLIRRFSIIAFYKPKTYGFDYFSVYLLRIYSHAFPIYFTLGFLIGFITIFLSDGKKELGHHVVSLIIFILGSILGDIFNTLVEYNRLYGFQTQEGLASGMVVVFPFFVALAISVAMGYVIELYSSFRFPEKILLIRSRINRFICSILNQIKIRIMLQNRFEYALLFGILFIATSIRFYNISHLGLRYWDAGFYTLETLKYLKGNQLQTTYGHILILSVAFSFFGRNPTVAIAYSAFIGSLTVYIIFLFGTELFDKKIGFFAASLLAVTEYHVLYSRSALTQANLVFFSLLSFYFYVMRAKASKKSNNLSYKNKRFNLVLIASMISGLLAGFCFMITWIGIIIIPSIIFTELFLIALKRIEWKKGLFFICVFAISSCLGVLVIIFSLIFMQRFQVSDIMGAHARVGLLWGSKFTLLSYFAHLLMLVNPLFIALFLFGIVIIIKERKFADLILLSWIIYFLIFFSGHIHREPRDYITSLPALLLIAARGSSFLYNLSDMKLSIKFQASKLKVFFVIFCSALLIPGTFSSFDTITLVSPAYRSASEFLIEDNCRGGLAHMSTIMVVYTNLPWHQLGDKAKLIEAHQRGFTHLIIDYNYLWNKHGEREIAQEILLKCPAVLVLPNDIATHTPTLRESVSPDLIEEILNDPYSRNLYVYRLNDVLDILRIDPEVEK
jgi:4-amino-4-deoxy-L-arabinose transferase-like glycosyltransferase